MGLDLSTSGTGISIFDSSGKHLHTEVVGPKDKELILRLYPQLLKDEKRATQFSRYDFIAKRTIQLANAYSVFGVIIENYAFSRKSNTVLGELGGIVRMCLLKNKIRVVEITPQSLKKFVTGLGSAAKSDLPLFVFKKWGEGFDGIKSSHRLDAADSYGLGKIAYYYFSGKGKLTSLKKVEADVIRKIRNALHKK